MAAKQDLRIDIHLTNRELENALGVHIPMELAVSGICLDTRVLKPGDLFIALKAARDGHDFVNTAFKMGAAACLVSHEMGEDNRTIIVPDTLLALQKLSTAWRKAWGKTVVAISGSNGKTTLKQMCKGLLQTQFKVLASPGSWNNHLGVPLSLLSLRHDDEVCVLEMGMNHEKELQELTRIAEPNIGVLTSIGLAHIEFFGTIDKIADAKWELMRGIVKGGQAIINLDDERLASRAKDLDLRKITIAVERSADIFCRSVKELPGEGFLVEVHYGTKLVTLKLSFLGRHNLRNALCALGVAFAAGVKSENLQRGFDAIELPEMRLERKVVSGIQFIVDCYNANPSSTMAAIDVLQSLPGKRKILVLGDMMELGVQSALLHKEVGMKAASAGLFYLAAIGQYGKDTIQGAFLGGMTLNNAKHYSHTQDLLRDLSGMLKPEDTILFKGSRANQLEKTVTALEQKLHEGAN